MHQPFSTSQLYNWQDFNAEYGLSDPQLWVDVKALAGDAGDNIPGVKGVGLKTALQLVQQLGDVESVLQQFTSSEAVQALQGKVRTGQA
jgi:DNA polymerase-1